MNQKKTAVVLGAGVTGLATAYALSKKGYRVHLVDKEQMPGGTCRSFKEDDFILDYGPHKFYTLVDGVLDQLCSIMGDDLLVREKSQSLYMQKEYFKFPLKMGEMLTKFPPTESFKILASFGSQSLKKLFQAESSETYEGFITNRFGRGLYRQIFEPMAHKIYGDPAKLDKKLAEVRISSPGLLSVMKQLLFRSKIDRNISAPKFHYPKHGFGMIPERLWQACEKNGSVAHFGSSVTNIEIEQGKVRGVSIKNSNGESENIPCDYLVYTIPLSCLKDLVPSLPSDFKKQIEAIRYRHTIIHYYLVNAESLLPAMWVFFPESQFRFGRLSESTKFSPHLAPKGKTALMVDFTCEDGDPCWQMSESELGAYLLEQMKPLNLFSKDQVIKSFTKKIRNFYPIYDVGFQKNLKSVRELEQKFGNWFFVGRLGDFNYNNSDQCLDMGFKAAEHISTIGKVNEFWLQLRQSRFEHYRIVD